MGNFNPAFYTQPNYSQLTPTQQLALAQYMQGQPAGGIYAQPSGTHMTIDGSPAQPQSGGLANTVGSVGGQYAGRYAANSLMGGGGSVATSQAPMSLAEMQSLSTGGNGMMSMGGASEGVGAVSGTPGAGAMTAAGSSPFSLAGIGGAGNVYLPALGAYGAYNLIRAQGDTPRGNYARGIGQGAASGAAMGSYFGPWGALIGGGVGGLVGGIGAATGSGKDQAQMDRDNLRKALQGAGIADSSYKINGLDIGLDGGAKQLDNLGVNLGGSKTRHSYDVDFSNPLSGGTVGAVNPLTMALLGQGAKQKQIDDLNGMITNSVMNGAKTQADINKNIQALYAKIPGLKTPGLPKGAVPSLNAPGVKLAAAVAEASRSKTSSPGISKDGKRISYSGGKK